MGRLRFYKRDPEAFIAGVVAMTLEEIGAYTLLLDHMYARGGALPDSPAIVCGMLAIDRRVWKRLRASLVMKGKIVDTGDGFLTNRRVEQELTWLEDTRQARAKAGSIGGQLSAKQRANALKTQEPGQPNAQALAQAKSNQSKKEKKNNCSSEEEEQLLIPSEAKASYGIVVDPVDDGIAGKVVVRLREPWPVQEAVDAYNRTAEACGWALCAKINEERRRKITTRLRDDGGLDGWRDRLESASRPSSYACDIDRNKGWKANIDWFISNKATLKIIEGQYDYCDPSGAKRDPTADDWSKRYAYFDRTGQWRADRGWGPPPTDAAHEGPQRLRRSEGAHP